MYRSSHSVLNKMDIAKLVELVKDKPELRGLDDTFVEHRLLDYIEGHEEFVEKYEQCRDVDQFTRTQEYEDMLKSVRKTLREVFGMFILDEDMESAMEDLEEDQSLANHMAMLSKHRSAKERLPFYEQVYEEIVERTGPFDSVLDVACGLNPFSYPFIPGEPEYHACDISPELCDHINAYFDLRGIEGDAFVLDLLSFDPERLPETDVCFMFKTLDSVESLERDYSRVLFDVIPADYFVVSFARQSLGGNEIPDARRAWFEELWTDFATFSVPNEKFYIAQSGNFIND